MLICILYFGTDLDNFLLSTVQSFCNKKQYKLLDIYNELYLNIYVTSILYSQINTRLPHGSALLLTDFEVPGGENSKILLKSFINNKLSTM